MANSFLLLCLTCFFLSIFCTDGIPLVIVNNCKDPIWPAILGSAGQKTPNGGGFLLPAGKQAVVEASKYWSGRIWARQGCRFDSAGRGWCQTGDCNGNLACRGIGGQPPATIVEMTLGTVANPLHYYDVSLVDGFNLPVSVIPVGGRGTSACGVAACEANVNAYCPSAWRVLSRGVVVGCKSACLATGDDKYCCSGKYGSPRTCKPTIYGHFFKNICPRAYSYAYDEETGLKTCRAKKYVITFCPPN